MQIRNDLFLLFSWRKACIFMLFLLWIFALVFGCFLGANVQGSTVSWMRAAPVRCVSIVSMLAVSLLPFLITAFAVYSTQTWLILPLAFFKAFSFAFFSVMLIFAFQGSGWLVRFLLMISDFAFLPLLFWLWVRALCGSCEYLYRDILICSVISTVVSFLNYFIVSPFLASLIS